MKDEALMVLLEAMNETRLVAVVVLIDKPAQLRIPELTSVFIENAERRRKFVELTATKTESRFAPAADAPVQFPTNVRVLFVQLLTPLVTEAVKLAEFEIVTELPATEFVPEFAIANRFELMSVALDNVTLAPAVRL